MEDEAKRSTIKMKIAQLKNLHVMHAMKEDIGVECAELRK